MTFVKGGVGVPALVPVAPALDSLSQSSFHRGEALRDESEVMAGPSVALTQEEVLHYE